MTQEYAQSMWLKYLKNLCLKDSRRICENPAKRFPEDLKRGMYDMLDDEEYEELVDDVEQEAALYNDDERASSYTIFLRAFQSLRLTAEELGRLAYILSESSARSDFSLPTE